MRLSLEKKIALAFGAALGLVVMISLIAYRNTTALLDLTAKAEETYEVLGTLEHLASLMKDVETGQRGYILTGDQLYLEPYGSALRSLPDSLERTRRLVGRQDSQQQRLGMLEGLIASRTAFAARTIELRRTEGPAAAEKEILSGQGKMEMDAIRRVIGEMQANERTRLLRRSNRAAQSGSAMIATVAGGGILAGLVLLLAGAGVRLDLTGRKLAEQQMRTRASQQAAIAELGVFALRCPSLKTLMDHIAARVAEVLAVDYSKILERVPGGRDLRLVAGVGWKEGCVGHAVVNGGERSQAGYTLSTKEPVIVDDLLTETRFTGPQLLDDHQVRSGLSVIVHGHHEAPYGVLGAHTRRHRTFTEDDAHFLEAAANILGMAVERKHAEAARASLAAIVESSNDAIIGMSLDGRIQSWNAGAERLFGYAEEEALGQPITLLRDHAHHYEQTAIIDRLRQGLSVVHTETLMGRKDGQKVPVAVTYSPIRDATGTTIGISKIAHDITTRKAAEERLRRSQTRQTLILRALPVVMYSATPWGDFGGIWISDNVERVTGFSSGQLVDDSHFWASRLHPDDRERALKEFEGIHETGALATEYRWQVADGTYHWFLDRAVLVRNPDRTPKEIIGVWMDITERKRIEETLREANEKLTALIHSSPIAIMVLDAEGRCTLWNPAAQRIFGWRADEVLGRPLPTIPTDRQEEHRAFRERVLRGEGFVEEEVLRQRKDGSRIAVSLHTAPLHDSSGKATGVMGLLLDITDRKRAEEALVRQAQILDQVHDSVVATDLNGSITSWNKGAERLFGYSAGEAMGRHVSFLYPEEEHGFLDTGVIAPLKAKGSHEVEVRMRRKSGECFYAHLALSLQRGADGHVSGMIGYSMDITDRKLAQEQLLHSREQLRALTLRLQEAQEEEQRRIAREIHDELGQALTGMKFDLIWLRKQLLASGAQDLVPNALKRLQSLLDLVDGTVIVVRRIATTLRPSVLDDLGLVAAMEWQAREFQDRTGVRCTLDADPRLGRVDPARSTAIFRIAQEALTNVARHANAGSVTVELGVVDGALTLVVQDDGRGIPAEASTQASSLGLLGMRERAAAFGGHLRIRGGPGGGTTVTATIPTQTSVATGA